MSTILLVFLLSSALGLTSWLINMNTIDLMPFDDLCVVTPTFRYCCNMYSEFCVLIPKLTFRFWTFQLMLTEDFEPICESLMSDREKPPALTEVIC